MSTGSGTGTPASSADTLTVAEISKAVLRRLRPLGMNVNNIEDELEEVLVDISMRDEFLTLTGSVTTVDGTQSYTSPTRMKSVEEMYISGGNHITPLHGGYEAFQQYIEDSSTPAEGEPQYYCVYNDKVYFTPIPDAAYTVVVEYTYFHESSTTIAYPSRFKSAIVNGVLNKLLTGVLREGKQNAQDSIIYHQMYENDLKVLKGTVKRQPKYIKYNDI